LTYLWRAAARQAGALADGAELARGLRAGGKLALADCSIRLDAGEVSYLETTVELWQYVGTTAPAYNRSTMIFGGGLTAMAVTAGLSAMANASRRRQEQVMSQMNWRSFGPVPLVVTNWRIMGCEQGRWLSWPYGSIRQVIPYLPKQLGVDVVFDEGTPATRFVGDSVPVLAVMLVHLLYDETLVWDGGSPLSCHETAPACEMGPLALEERRPDVDGWFG